MAGRSQGWRDHPGADHPPAFVMRRECPRITAIAEVVEEAQLTPVFSARWRSPPSRRWRGRCTIENFAPMPTITAKARAIAIAPWLAGRVGENDVGPQLPTCFSPVLPAARWLVRGRYVRCVRTGKRS